MADSKNAGDASAFPLLSPETVAAVKSGGVAGAGVGNLTPSVSVGRPERWDLPFSDTIDDRVADELLACLPFSKLDPANFPRNLPLRGLLRNDCRIVDLADGEFVVRAGDYGNSAFFILEGAVQVVLDPLPAAALGRAPVRQKTFWESLSQLWTRPRIAELRRLGKVSVASANTATPFRHIPLADIPHLLNERRTVRLEAGELFGEIAALGRIPRTSTILSAGRTRLLEIRWQGLRELRRFDPEWKDRLDRLYRERSLSVQLKQMPWFAGLDEATMKVIADNTRFETYGQFDWHGTYRALKADSAANLLAHEPVIVREGDYLNGLVIVRGGFTRLSRRYNNGERTVSYMGKGEVFGLPEFARHRLFGVPLVASHTLRALGYVDVLVIPTVIVERYILPQIAAAELARHAASHEAAVVNESETADVPPAEIQDEARASLLEFMVEQRVINGTATMLIDLNRCTRCDDCVRACASAHENNPRFVRHGHVHENIMVAQACMHCIDPVCMIGCPTGAIHRSLAGGEVVINDQSCVGCSTCANSCPYENIQMVPVRDDRGDPYVDHRKQPILKATKCDLCVDQIGGPACVRACPHDALARVPLNDSNALDQWLQR